MHSQTLIVLYEDTAEATTGKATGFQIFPQFIINLCDTVLLISDNRDKGGISSNWNR